MKYKTNRPRPTKYIYLSLNKDETAREILDRGKKKLKREKEAGAALLLKEFSKEGSFDVNGDIAKSPQLVITRQELKPGQTHNLCSRIETSIGAPFLTKNEITHESCSLLKVRPISEISERLAKYKKKQMFELKSLREICVQINTVEEPASRYAVSILSYLYNLGHGRNKKNIVIKLQSLILQRERDKLFYMRRHPKQRMLHSCHDDTILEQIKHLEWVFIGKHPFEGVKSNALSYSKYV